MLTITIRNQIRPYFYINVYNPPVSHQAPSAQSTWATHNSTINAAEITPVKWWARARLPSAQVISYIHHESGGVTENIIPFGVGPSKVKIFRVRDARARLLSRTIWAHSWRPSSTITMLLFSIYIYMVCRYALVLYVYYIAHASQIGPFKYGRHLLGGTLLSRSG